MIRHTNRTYVSLLVACIADKWDLAPPEFSQHATIPALHSSEGEHDERHGHDDHPSNHRLGCDTVVVVVLQSRGDQLHHADVDLHAQTTTSRHCGNSAARYCRPGALLSHCSSNTVN